MANDLRELSFLRDLYINDEWTKRFTDLVDEKIEFDGVENLLYLNAGTGNHCFALREKISDDTAFFAYCDDEHLLKIAREKAAAINSDIDFSMLRFENDSFDRVIADGSFSKPDEVGHFIEDAVRVIRSGGDVAIMLLGAGSFGEVYSMLWEALTEIRQDGGELVETMISSIATVSAIEEIAKNTGLVNIETHSALEVFDFENGQAFIKSPLVENFLMPEWLKGLEENEKEQVRDKLAQLIDAEDGDLSFRFSAKVVLLTGEKE